MGVPYSELTFVKAAQARGLDDPRGECLKKRKRLVAIARMVAQDQEEAFRDRPEFEAARQIAGMGTGPFMGGVAVQVQMQSGIGEFESVFTGLAFQQRRFCTRFNIIAQCAVARGVVHVVRGGFDQTLMQRVAVNVFLRDQREVDVGDRLQIVGGPQRADHARCFIGMLAARQQKSFARACEIGAENLAALERDLATIGVPMQPFADE